jgi:hypothetical protein
MIFPVRYYLAADDHKPEQPLTPQIRSRVSSLSPSSSSSASSSAANVNDQDNDQDDDSGEELETEAELLSGVLSDLSDYIKIKFNDEAKAAYEGVMVNNFTTFGGYDDWNAVLAAANNDTWIAPTRDAIYGQVLSLSLYIYCVYSIYLMNRVHMFKKFPLCNTHTHTYIYMFTIRRSHDHINVVELRVSFIQIKFQNHVFNL